MVKFIYYEKATKFSEISTLLLSYVVPVKSKVEISQNSVAFSEYMNFTENMSLLLLLSLLRYSEMTSELITFYHLSCHSSSRALGTTTG